MVEPTAYDDKEDSELLELMNLDGVSYDKFKLNPDLYIHNALFRTQNALFKDDMKSGFVQFVLGMEQLEILAKASRKLPPTYDAQISEFRNNPELQTFSKDIQDIKLANKKLELIMSALFAGRNINVPLKL